MVEASGAIVCRIAALYFYPTRVKQGVSDENCHRLRSCGFKYKEKIKELLIRSGHEVEDFGTDSEEPVDYPLFIRPVALAVARGDAERGVVLGGSGNGEAMVANRVKGVRCALCWNVETAVLGRRHNDANVISIGERMVTEDVALDIVKAWLETPFDGGRHLHRIQLIDSAD